MTQAIRQSTRFLVGAVATSVLLISPALAQVNGSGTSPSSLFDVVLNLPGDEAVITGADAESIGGVSGQTTQLNVSASSVVGNYFDADFGSEVNISGGTLGVGFDALSGSEVNISGGSVGSSFEAESGSVLKISGGAIGQFFRSSIGSDVQLIGGEFRLNGADFTGGSIALGNGDVFSGTLADGSSFFFSNNFNLVTTILGDSFSDATLTVVDLPPAETIPIVLDSPIVNGPWGLRADQELTVVAGGFLGDNISLVDATLNVEDGAVGQGAKALNSQVNISGGMVGNVFGAYTGSEVNISGGTVDGIEAFSGSVVNVSGGTVNYLFIARPSSIVNISGGNFRGGEAARSFDALATSVVNISGGTFDNDFRARSDSVVNISGTAFSIAGTPVNNLQPNQPVLITDRDVTISGVLANGDPFSFDLNSQPGSGDVFQNRTTVTVTLVAPFLLGDCNEDGVVNFQDINSFIGILASDSFLDQADCNRDGAVNFLDIQPFIQLLANN